MEWYLIAWLWSLGMPLAYGTFRSQDAGPSWGWAIASTFWPVTAPLLLVIGLLATWAEYRRHRRRIGSV